MMLSMARKSCFALAILLALLFTVVPGCKPRKKNLPVYVRVLSNLSSPYGHQLDHRLLDFQTSNPRTASGRPIVVQIVEIGDYKDMLQKHIGVDTTVELIILDAPQDAAMNSGVQADMAHAVDICAALKACPQNVPAIIPSGTEGERLQAAQKFQDFLVKNTPTS